MANDDSPLLQHQNGQTTQTTSKWEKVSNKLRKEGIPETDIKYIEEITNEQDRNQLNTCNIAIAHILQHKIQQSNSGLIKRRGILDKFQRRIRGRDVWHIIKLPETREYKIKIQNMNESEYINNIIEWQDYNKLVSGDIIDFRKDDGKFILAQVMRREGIKLTLITSEKTQITLNYLDQYPYQRLFKGGAVTQRIPADFKDKKIKLNSTLNEINAGYVHHNYRSNWRKGTIVDIDTAYNESKQVKQVQIEFQDLNNYRRYRFWTHLDNKKEIHYDNLLLLILGGAAGGLSVGAGAVFYDTQLSGGGGLGQLGGGGGGSWNCLGNCLGNCCDDCCDDCCDMDCNCRLCCCGGDGDCGFGFDCCNNICCGDDCCGCDCDCGNCDCDCDCGGCDCDCDLGGCDCVIM